MINIRHTGIYVDNLERMTNFYKQVFGMVSICENEPDSCLLLDELFGVENAKIITTKLITAQGKIDGRGDMVELVKVASDISQHDSHSVISNIGVMHIAIGVDSIEETVQKVIGAGGNVRTKIFTHENGNKIAFVVDPEGNWLELIERW